jgi:DNA adenine methylase
VIYENPDMFDRIKRAWAIWLLANSSYGCMLKQPAKKQKKPENKPPVIIT